MMSMEERILSSTPTHIPARVGMSLFINISNYQSVHDIKVLTYGA